MMIDRINVMEVEPIVPQPARENKDSDKERREMGSARKEIEPVTPNKGNGMLHFISVQPDPTNR